MIKYENVPILNHKTDIVLLRQRQETVPGMKRKRRVRKTSFTCVMMMMVFIVFVEASRVNFMLINTLVEQVFIDYKFKKVYDNIFDNLFLNLPLVFSFTTNPPPTLFRVR